MILTRSTLATVLLVCTVSLWASGALFAWNLGADSRWRERECRAANAEVRRELDEAAWLLAEADGKVKQAKRVAWIWHQTSGWYQSCCLRGGP